jgi:LCP family protein required for cell wall assembly
MKNSKKLKQSKTTAQSLMPYTRGFTLSPNSAALIKEAAPTAVMPKRRSFSFKKLLKRTAILILVLAIVLGGWLGWKFYQTEAKITGDKNPLSLFGILDPSPLNETNGRVNILLAGNSSDDPGHQGAELTDSIMIVSIDPTNKTAFLLSIPRDTWVDIPGYGYSKINAAYEDGGMNLLSQVIQTDFGVTTDYNALIDYTAFRDAVNAVGGINVNIASTDPRGLYDPNANLKLSNGEQTINGQTALDLARARGDGYGSYGFPQGDFNRTANQRLMLVAIKDKATSTGTVINPLKISQLADAIGNNVQTNMQVGQLVTLFNDVKGISDSGISSYSLNSFNGKDLLKSYYTYNGQDALIPAAGLNDFSQIQSDIQSILVTPSNNQ